MIMGPDPATTTARRADAGSFLYRTMGCSCAAQRCRISCVQVRRFQMSRIALGLTPYFLASLAEFPPCSGSAPASRAAWAKR